MVGPRLVAPQVRRQLSAKTHQLRQLHITGAATCPSLCSASAKAVAADRLMSPLQSFESKRLGTGHNLSIESSARHFNPSRGMKGAKDFSTIDFTYLPASSLLYASPIEEIRVPILPGTENAMRSFRMSDDIVSVHRPEISTASADSTHISAPSAMSEISDTGLHMEFEAVTKKAIGAAEKIAAAASVDEATQQEVLKKA